MVLLILGVVGSVIVLWKWETISAWAMKRRKARKAWQQSTQESMDRNRETYKSRHETAELEAVFALPARNVYERNVR